MNHNLTTSNNSSAPLLADEPASLAQWFTAIADPLRLRALRLLEMRELTVGELAKVLQSPQSTISRHLKVLSEAGWLIRRCEGAATFHRMMFDCLPAYAQGVWAACRDQCVDSQQAAEDSRRLDAVLAERRLDSRSYFGRVAGEWDDVRAELFGRGFTPIAMLSLLDPSWTIADLGCGTGNAAEHLAPFVAKVVAVDQSEPMLDAASRRLDRFDNIEFRTGDLESLPLDNNTVDVTVTLLVLHHSEDPSAPICEMFRVLKPGGSALIVDMYSHDHTEYRTTMGHKQLGFSAPQMTQCFTAAGFGQPRVIPLPSHPDAKGPGLFIATGRKPE
jgi:ubiquinone/menaquinone biosynthesis C-methylase UbiE/DNA-binding transcriptional ArsR family regulator